MVLMNVVMNILHDHASNDVRVLMDMYAIGIRVNAYNSGSVMSRHHVQKILTSITAPTPVKIITVARMKIASCRTVIQWVAVQCVSVTMDMLWTPMVNVFQLNTFVHPRNVLKMSILSLSTMEKNPLRVALTHGTGQAKIGRIIGVPA